MEKRGANRIKVVIAEDHAIVREGLKGLVETNRDMSVVAMAAEGRTAVAMARDLQPDVLIMDISMPQLNGIDATRQICLESPDVNVLCLSMHSETHFVSSMLAAGARGYLVKQCVSDELVTAIREVAAGNTYVSPSLASDVVEDILTSHSRTGPSPLSKLTDREREVLQLISEGCSTKEIAEKLHLSPKTVGTHREHLMAKLQTRSIAELTRYALREGLSQL